MADPALTTRQRTLLAEWLPGYDVVADHSWGLVGTTVLELVHGGERWIAKAGDDADRQIARELQAHRDWLGPWVARGRAPRLRFADDDAKLLVTGYLPGRLVQGDEAERSAEVYRQAGALLGLLHRQQPAVSDAGYETRARDKALAWLAGPHRIDPATVARLRAEIDTWPTTDVALVPTHGDWQPRNWLVDDDGVVRVIDLGRADLRPPMVDLVRLAAQQFRVDPALERAFLDGYGADPREPAAWRRERMREAIGTACWAHAVGDGRFERQGHRMIAEVLDDQR